MDSTDVRAGANDVPADLTTDLLVDDLAPLELNSDVQALTPLEDAPGLSDLYLEVVLGDVRSDLYLPGGFLQ